ncbi:MAG: hypothetical protein OQK09_09630 [Colwellia sp.]|nr:hypothetical protein [Colwellia sp.]MCW8864352.1 hypothetical protein [Colwellia sp.]MCW9081758.1 hypothetical protein [Colwellia sp.]
MRQLSLILIILFLTACATQGQLEYITAEGERKTACETEYTWAPSVDKYAVEYILSYCAKKAVKQGHKVIDETLLEIDLSLPTQPNSEPWTFEYAQELHSLNQLSDKEYGYIIAYLDLNAN